MRGPLLLLLSLFPLAFAQQNPILKTVEPDYGADTSQPMITLPMAVRFEFNSRGVPVYLASLDGGLDDRVVQALAEYRFVQLKNGGSLLVSVPVKELTSDYASGSKSFHGPTSFYIQAAAKLNDQQARKLDQEVSKKPDIGKISTLLAWALEHPEPWVPEMRARHLAWLVENAPEAYVLVTTAGLIAKQQDPAGYGRIRALWLAQVQKHPTDHDVLTSATHFLSLSDPADVDAFLRPVAGRMVRAMELLGATAAYTSIGVRAVDPLTGVFVEAANSLPGDAYASGVRSSLLRETQLPILLTAFATMNSAAGSLAVRGEWPQGYDSFCSRLRDHIRTIQTTFTGTCRTADVLELPPDLMKGRLSRQVAPTYPPAAKQLGIQGTVTLSALIGTDGKIKKLRLVSGPLALYATARNAVARWEYKPYLNKGHPVEVMTYIDVNFALR